MAQQVAQRLVDEFNAAELEWFRRLVTLKQRKSPTRKGRATTQLQN
jgi:hypothetical protein